MAATILRLSLLTAFFLPSLNMANDRPLTVDDLLALESVGNPQVSPDGQWVAYTISSRDTEEDKRTTQIWMVSSDGGTPIPMTSAGYSASNPRWSPDNKYLSFSASKDEDAKSQPELTCFHPN